MSTHLPSRRGFLGLTGAALGTFALAGCSTGAETGNSGAVTKPSTKPDRIIVRTWGDPWASTVKELVAGPFTEETGIAVEFDLGDFGPTHVKIQQALESGSRPPVDVVHTVGFFAEKARAQDLVVPLGAEAVPNLAALSSTGLPESGTASDSPFVNAYGYTFPMIYDADQIDLSKGFAWADLQKSEFAKSYFAASTFEVLAFPFAKMLGIDPSTDSMDPVWEALREIRPSLSGFGQDSDFSTSLRGGQSKMGAFIAGNGVALREDGMNIKWVVPEEGVSLTNDSLYVPGGLPDDVTYWSQVFINTWLEQEIQTEFCETMGVIPVNAEAGLADYMMDDPAFPFTDEEIAEYAIPVPLEVTARNQDDWQGKYVAALQG